MEILFIHNHYKQSGGEDVRLAQQQQFVESRVHPMGSCARSSKLDKHSPLRILLVPEDLGFRIPSSQSYIPIPGSF